MFTGPPKSKHIMAPSTIPSKIALVDPMLFRKLVIPLMMLDMGPPTT
ncbi:Uncharacterised protein [Vibrio cholerae]|nr:Uncharacterised protein [Vibrio cholerae]